MIDAARLEAIVQEAGRIAHGMWPGGGHALDFGRGRRPQRRCPHRRREVAVPGEAGDHVPVQVGHHVPEGSEVHLVGLQVPDQHLLQRDQRLGAQDPLVRRQLGELAHVPSPDEPVERREAALVRAHHPERLAAAITAIAQGKLGAFRGRAEAGGL